ncbi:uncharacterized protein LOC129741592 [Uranotaenia lowii]|uniref:uncharacterized protein LOC129741592 n=1 Tax=Uranotaenia lowii TaxID=190385 RepID=UPI00247AEB21|nr:uncharacterized protein LOC129741592 [Uranotaenia lowii]
MNSTIRGRGAGRGGDRLLRPTREPDMGLAMRANEVEVVISEFDPDNIRGQTAEEWLAELDSMAEIFGWDPRRTLLYACMRLKGPAKFWYDGYKQELRTWDIFKDKFLENFPTVVDTAGIHRKLLNLKRRPEQSVESYFHEIVAMGRKIKLSDDLIKQYLINGLPYASTRAVMAQDPAVTLPQFLAALIRVERAAKDNIRKRDIEYNGRGGHIRTPAKRFADGQSRDDAARASTSYSQTPQRQTPNKTTTESSSSKIAYTTPTSQKRQCFICRSEDHLARRCPQKKDFRTPVVPNRATM